MSNYFGSGLFLLGVFCGWNQFSLKNIAYNLIYMYSKCQILYQQHITPLLTLPFANNITVEYSFVEDYGLLFVGKLNNKIKLQLIEYTNDYIDDTMNNVDLTQIYTFVKPEFKFMLIEVCIGDGKRKYKIDLTRDTVDYFIVGNKLTRAFFIYYINTYFQPNDVKYDITAELVTLYILDHNFEKYTFEMPTLSECIHINKNGYELTVI